MTLEERIPIKVLFDRKDAAEWQRLNPVIDDGELVVELDTHRLKVGDGKLNYNNLPYYEGPQGESVTKVQLSENGELSVWIGDKETKLGNIKGQKGDKGTSITDITKDGETLTIKLSDSTQKTFNIPNGSKGDKGDSVKSARVDEEGNFYVTIEGQSEKQLGNIKGGKGDKGDPLKLKTLPLIKSLKLKLKTFDLSAYATKAELAEIDVSKQLTDYLSKTEAESTYAKASHKHSLSDITI
ncbi:hyaluronoglucosaminidase [Streptococcus dysgalactiae]|nr:hyaluronoglucosaminidase [Streptococcus dysgalactiae]